MDWLCGSLPGVGRRQQLRTSTFGHGVGETRTDESVNVVRAPRGSRGRRRACGQIFLLASRVDRRYFTQMRASAGTV